MGRAPCCDKANVKKGPWSPEEDTKLKEYIEKYGTGGNWIALPQKAGLKRCGKSCRLRWLNYLRPNIKHGDFSDEEDRIICSLFATIGSRWSIIAAQLPGRTDNDIKNYWNTKLKKKLMGNINVFPSSSSHQIRKPQQFLSSSNYLNSSSQVPFHQSLLSLYKDYNTCFYNTTHHGLSPAKSFNGLEFVSSSSSLVPSSNLLNDTSNNHNNSISSTNSLVFQTQESLVNPNFQYGAAAAAADAPFFTAQSLRHADCEKSSPTAYNPSGKENNNFLVFGSDQRSCSSSDGSCGQNSYGRSEIKQEDSNNLDYIHQSNNPSTLISSNVFEEDSNNNQRVVMNMQGGVDYGNNNNQYNYGCFGDNQNGLDSELEAVKRLIISSSSSGSNSFIDEIKTEEEKGVYYFY